MDEEVIIEALSHIGGCTIFSAASRLIMDYITAQINSDNRIYTGDLGRYVRDSLDDYIRHCIRLFSDTDEGRALIEHPKRFSEA